LDQELNTNYESPDFDVSFLILSTSQRENVKLRMYCEPCRTFDHETEDHLETWTKECDIESQIYSEDIATDSSQSY
jgi:hypothetical protein